MNLDLFLYDVATGGSDVWSETQTLVPVSGGVFSIGLGDVNPLPTSIFVGVPLYLGIRVDGSAELAPRTELRTSPFAFKSFDSDNLGGLGPDGYVSVTGDDMTGPLGLYGGVQALEAGGVSEQVTSTTDVIVRKFYLDGTQGDGWSGDAAIVLSFNGVGDTAVGGGGTATVYKNDSIVATIAVPGGGGRPWTYRVNVGPVVADDYFDVAVRAGFPLSPLYIREISMDLTGAPPSGGNTLDQAYDEGGAGAGRTITADNGDVVIATGGLTAEGGLNTGVANTSNGALRVYDAAQNNPIVELVPDSQGGSIFVRDGNDVRKTYIETDSSPGGGAWFGLYGDAGFSGYFNVDANASGSGDPVVTVQGDGGTMLIDTRETGDDYLQLPGEAIAADEIVDEPGISQGRVTNNVAITEVSTMEDVVTTTITIPAAGYIHLSASAQARMVATTANASEYISFQIDEAAGGSQNSAYYYLVGFSGSPETGTHYIPVHAQRTFFKAVPGTYTFRLEARNAAGASAKNMWNPSITALYTPTSYGTVTAAANPKDVAQFDDVQWQGGGDNGDGVTSSQSAVVDLRDLEIRVAREEAQLAEARRRLYEAEQAQNGPEAIR